MELQRPRESLHRLADCVDDRWRVRRWIISVLDEARHADAGDGELLAAEWQAISPKLKRRIIRRAAGVGIALGFGSKFLIGLETFVLVLLAFNGGQLTLRTEASHPSFWEMLVALVIGTAVALLFSLLLLRPQVRWFVDDGTTDRARRRAVARVPMQQVGADLAGWAVSFGVYALIAEVSPLFLATVGGAFAFAAVTSCCLTYLFAEAAARPLTVLALSGASEPSVVHGVRERMVVVWLVSSAVPMAGLITINFGRWMDWLPPGNAELDWSAVFLALISLTSGLTVVMLVGRAIADPLTEMREVVESASEGDFGRRVAVYDVSELGVLQSGLNNMLDGLAERERIRALFSKHVGDRVAELAISQGGEMVGTNADVGVIFVDLTGSTTFAAQRDPRETAVVLNVFFSVVAEVVERHDGLINKFEGDAALIVFGAPATLADPAGAALCAARELGEALSEKVPLEWGMGVGYGRVFAGNIGAASRYEYTVIGDPVNESARLSDWAKDCGSPVCASGDAVAAADPEEAQLWSSTGSVQLRGRTATTEVFVPSTLAARTEPPTLGSVLAELVKLPARRARREQERR
ncbi:adenylate/guanylate cyclase domain-containing protein [Gordonia iterans]|uniref:Adenylate/guanylate cyclase domain-containing protein n=1 Tax=Gordonia iterans TaxID=1004901 RepID=A0A2S0KDF0_9ACTN|nr:adenylate/guanylate cyclase domain-containing protein [Gordonia iterans]AVL99675.1 adenylate/guanylate cyclase domain-containing protein [Gordonia iterans]